VRSNSKRLFHNTYHSSLWRKLPLPEDDDYDAEMEAAGELAEADAAEAAEGSGFQHIVSEMVASGC
jgi:hypothetical protein